MNSNFCVAVHGMVYLKHKAGIVSSEELAGNICTNPARVRKVMALMKKSGLVETREGKVGGYFCMPDAGGITLGRIAEALDEHFVESGWHSGGRDMKCLIASGMADVMDDLYGRMDALCVDMLHQITLDDLEHRLFFGHDGQGCGQGSAQ